MNNRVMTTIIIVFLFVPLAFTQHPDCKVFDINGQFTANCNDLVPGNDLFKLDPLTAQGINVPQADIKKIDFFEFLDNGVKKLSRTVALNDGSFLTDVFDPNNNGGGNIDIDVGDDINDDFDVLGSSFLPGGTDFFGDDDDKLSEFFFGSEPKENLPDLTNITGAENDGGEEIENPEFFVGQRDDPFVPNLEEAFDSIETPEADDFTSSTEQNRLFDTGTNLFGNVIEQTPQATGNPFLEIAIRLSIRNIGDAREEVKREGLKGLAKILGELKAGDKRRDEIVEALEQQFGDNLVNIRDDGTVLIRESGKLSIIDPDGTIREIDGPKETIRRPDGTVFIFDKRDGTETTKEPDGTVIIEREGTITTKTPDGTTIIENQKDNSTTTKKPNGTVIREDSSGIITIIKPDGIVAAENETDNPFLEAAILLSSRNIGDARQEVKREGLKGLAKVLGELKAGDKRRDKIVEALEQKFGDNLVNIRDDGTVLIRESGKLSIIDADGTIKEIDGPKETIRRPDGTVFIFDKIDGTETTKELDGTVIIENSREGTITTTKPDGTVTVENK